MSDFEELRKRVEAAGRQFSAIARQRRDYGQRLIDMISQHERDLSENQARMAALRDQAERAQELAERRAAELRGAKAENEQLRHMLHSLLQAIESGRPNDFEETMHELDRRISTMVAGAGPALAPPATDEAPSGPGPEEEGDLPAGPVEWAGEQAAGAGEAGWVSSGLEPEDGEPARPPSLQDVFLQVDAAAADAVPHEVDQDGTSTIEPDDSEYLLDDAERDAFALKQSPISAIADSIVAETRGRPGRFDLSEEDLTDPAGRGDSGSIDTVVAMPEMSTGRADHPDQDDDRPFDLLEEEPTAREGGIGGDDGKSLDRLFDDSAYDDDDDETLGMAGGAAEAMREEGDPRDSAGASDNEFDLSDLALGGEIEDRLDVGLSDADGAETDTASPARGEPGLDTDLRTDDEDLGAGDVPPDEMRGKQASGPAARRGSLSGDSALEELEALLAEEDIDFAADADVAPPQDALEAFPPPRAPQGHAGRAAPAAPSGTASERALRTAPALRDDLDEASREEILAKLRQSQRSATETGRN